MPQRHQLALIALSALIVIGAFIALRPDDDEPRAPIVTATGTAPPSTSTQPTPPPPPPRPVYTQIRVRGLKPVGGVQRITVSKGETVRLAVRSDQPEEAHLHGYDISRPVGPGKRGRLVFTARLEGIYELELEHAAVPIAELRVNP